MSQQPPENQRWAIYNRIKEYRRAKGLSQKELADELDLNHRSIGYFENQDFDPNLRLAWRIADYFGVELEDVFFRDEYPPPDSLRQSLATPEQDAAQPSGESTDQSRQRPATYSVLTALLDGYGADRERLTQRAGLDTAALEAELSALEEERLVEESVQPGPVFGRPHSTSYRLTSEGHSRIVELHRSQLPKEDQ